MEVTKWEIAGRGAASVGVWAIALAAGLGSVLGTLFVSALDLFAVFCLSVAALSWSVEDTVPWRARAADIIGCGVVIAALAVQWFVGTEAVVAFLADGLAPIAAASFAIGTTSKAVQQPSSTISASAGLLGALIIAVGAATWFVTGAWQGFPVGASAGGVGLLLLAAGLEREQVNATVSGRPFQYGSGATLLITLATALSIGSYLLAERNDYTWDLTNKKSFSLSDQAKHIVDAVSFDVQVTAFFRSTSPGRAPFADLIERFAERNKKITVEWIDPLQEPSRASAADITGDQGTILLDGNGRQRRLEWEISEADLIRELVLLASDTDHNLCWSLGHGEPHPDDEFSEDGLGAVRLQLEGLNYKVANIEIAKTGIPRDCAVLIIARPTTEWFPFEQEALAAYLAMGGRALVLLDAGDVPELAAEMERYGVVVGNDVVVDLNLKNQMLGVQDPSFVVLSAEDFGNHPITRSLAAALVMPVSRSVRASKEPPSGIRASDLLRTSPEAWGETEPEGANPTPDEGIEVIGEVPVMAVVEIDDPAAIHVITAEIAGPPPMPTPDAAPGDTLPDPSADRARDRARGVPSDYAPTSGGRLVVIGDSDFAANRFLGWGNNRDLFLNTIAWLTDEDAQLGERPEEGDTLEIGAGAEALLCLVSIVVIPAIALFTAGIVLWRRRSL